MILLTGATGYVGGRLLRAFQDSGERVRCLARRPANLEKRVGPGVEVVRGDVLEPVSLEGAFEGVKAAYYMVHSMASSGDFVEQDRKGAENFSRAAKEAGVERIIYLGGLGHEDELTDHLASRHEVGRVLRESGVPTIEFRASIIIGSGSLSFEMIRALVGKLAVMITPRWVRARAQPIAIEDVVEYLLEASRIPLEGDGIFEIGGRDVASYREIMLEYARQRGLKRIMIPAPVLSPGLSGLWLGLVTPVYARVGRKLIESVRHDTCVQDGSARRAFSVRPKGLAEAIERALAKEDSDFAETRWSDALSSYGGPHHWGGIEFGSRLVDSRAIIVGAPLEKAFAPIRRIGGKNGWYYGDFLWRVRGWLDLLAGGPGLRRGRRNAESIEQGETLDFWRVEAYEPGRLLRLQAEMKVPGRAWLQFEVDQVEGGSSIRQTALFDPLGLLGRLYWYMVFPLHALIFQGMLRRIAARATAESKSKPPAETPSSAT